MLKFEMHLHNSENSSCASASARDIPALYRDKGYDGIFVTNHYNRFVLDFLSDGKRLTHTALMDRFLYGYRTIREEGEKIGLRVLLGAELSPHRYISPWGGHYPGMEFLTYGLDEQFFYDNSNLHLLSQEELFAVVDGAGAVMFQAHPFRVYCVLGDHRYMHGVEAFNALNEKYGTEANQKASAFAAEHNLLCTAGTDFHHTDTERFSGLYLPQTINTPQAFAEYIKKNKAEFVK